MGNHKIMMLEARDSAPALARWMGEESGGIPPLHPTGESLQSIPAQHWEFIEAFRSMNRSRTFSFMPMRLPTLR